MRTRGNSKGYIQIGNERIILALLHHGGSVTDLRVNYTTDTKYYKVATQKLRELLIPLKILGFFV